MAEYGFSLGSTQGLCFIDGAERVTKNVSQKWDQHLACSRICFWLPDVPSMIDGVWDRGCSVGAIRCLLCISISVHVAGLLTEGLTSSSAQCMRVVNPLAAAVVSW